jgi:hypothetical protein
MQEFFFDGITLEEIKTKQVRVEVCHQSAQKLQKDLDIGEVRIPLKDFNSQFQTKKEIRVRVSFFLDVWLIINLF